MNVKYVRKEVNIMKIAIISIGIAFAAIAVLLVLGLTGSFSGLGVRYILAPFTGAVEQREITNKGAFRIQAYEQFYRWQEAVEAIDVKLSVYTGELDTRQKSECIGLVARRTDMVGRYNAAVRSVQTQGKWKSTNLPNRLEHHLVKCG